MSAVEKVKLVNYWYLLRNPEAELWTKIEGFDRYKISSKAQVKSFVAETGIVLAPQQNKEGYKFVTLYDNNSQPKKVSIHRLVALHFIPNPDFKSIVDHINGNRSQNGTANLRWATISENNRNTAKKANATSKYKGVSWKMKKQMWFAAIKINGRRKELGYYHCEEDAATAYDSAAKLYFESFARLNHIDQLKRDRMKKYRQKKKEPLLISGK